jgi:hypothetical protein
MTASNSNLWAALAVSHLIAAAAVAAPQNPPAPVLTGGGAFQSVRAIEFRAPSGEIRYTTDGTDPTASSPLAGDSELFADTTEIRARVFEGGTAGPVARTFVTKATDPWLAFDGEGAGSVLIDSSPRRMHGQLVGATRVAGMHGTGVEFAGGSDRVELGDFAFPANAVTMSAWVYADSFPTQDVRILSKATGVNDQDHVFMVSTIGSSHRLRFRLRTNGVTTTLFASTGSVQVGRWHHIAASYDGSTMRLFLDGELVGSTAKTGPIDQTTEPVWLGNNPIEANRGFDGVIDEVMLFDRTLSPLEVRGLAADAPRPGIDPTGRSQRACGADVCLEAVSVPTSDKASLVFAGRNAPANAPGLLMVSADDGPNTLFGMSVSLDLDTYIAFSAATGPDGTYTAEIPLTGALEGYDYFVQALFLNTEGCAGSGLAVASNGLRLGIQQPSVLEESSAPQDPPPTGGSGTPDDPGTDPGDIPDNGGASDIPPDDGPPVTFDFFVDALDGSDNNAGTAAAPWRTLGKALASAPSGSFVGVRDGNYGSLGLSGSQGRNDYVTLKAVPGAAPRILGMSFDGNTGTDLWVAVDGFEIYAPSSTNVIYLKHGRHVRVMNCEIRAQKWAVNGVGRDGFEILNCDDILVQHNYLHEVMRGATMSNTSNITFRRNLIRPKAGTAIQYAGGNSNCVIEHNHIWGAPYVPYPQDPDAFQGPHASMISIRSDNLTIRGNHMHGMGNSSGMMFYTPDAAGGLNVYSNILIENNAIYDVTNTYVMRMYNLGTNVVVRNNLMYSGYRTGDCGGHAADARYRYRNAIVVHSIAPGYDGSGLEVYNNIFMGIVSIPSTAVERNNIIWAWGPGTWRTTSPSGTSMIVQGGYGGCGNFSSFFEGGQFFQSTPNLWFPQPIVHDWTLKADSIGVNFGNPTVQPSWSIGSIGADGFVVLDGPERNSTRHSVGPFERRD